MNHITSSSAHEITSLPKEQTPHWEFGLWKPLFANRNSMAQCDQATVSVARCPAIQLPFQPNTTA